MSVHTSIVIFLRASQNQTEYMNFNQSNIFRVRNMPLQTLFTGGLSKRNVLVNQPNIFRVLKNMSLLSFFFQEAQLMPTNVLINFSAKFCRRVWKMFLPHKTRCEVSCGRNSGMYLRGKNFCGTKRFTYLLLFIELK